MIEQTTEWITAKKYLSGQKASRTKADYFEHVEEGVKILQILGEPLVVQAAFAIHPLYQSDEALTNHYPLLSTFDPVTVALTMEYRSVANRGIRREVKKNNWTVELSCLFSVNQMLVSDKIQNRKLFLNHYPKNLADYAEIDRYFDVWLKALNISEKRYEEIVNQL